MLEESEIELLDSEVLTTKPKLQDKLWPHWIGVGVIIGLAVVPDLNNAIGSLSIDQDYFVTIGQLGYSLIYRSAKVSAILLAVMLLTKTEWSSIGFGRIKWRDPATGILIWLGGTIAFYVTAYVLAFIYYSQTDVFGSFQRPTTNEHYLWILAASLANGFAEEIILRGYLLTRLEKLLQSTWLAVVLTSLMFASYHIYQGVGPMIGIFALSLVYGLAFCRIRRIWPLVMAHALADFVGLSALAYQ